MNDTPPSPNAGSSIDAATPAERAGRLRAIGLMCLALSLFSCLDATAKYLSPRFDTMQIVWCRYAIHTLVAFLMFNPLVLRGILQTRHLTLQIGRSALLLGSTVFNFLALRSLQLDQAATINFSQPLIVAVLSGPVLGEWIGPRRLIAIMVGFIGVLIVMQPGFGTWQSAFLLSASCALAGGSYNVATRVLARYDSSGTTFLYTGLVGMLGTLPAMPFVWTNPTNLLDGVLLVLLGLFGGVGHYLLIVAHRHAPAAVLAPFIYTQLIWTLIFGFTIFGDLPGIATLAGAAVVVASGLYLLYRERVRHVAHTGLGQGGGGH